jgi:hypothetical protein
MRAWIQNQGVTYTLARDAIYVVGRIHATWHQGSSWLRHEGPIGQCDQQHNYRGSLHRGYLYLGQQRQRSSGGGTYKQMQVECMTERQCHAKTSLAEHNESRVG